MSHHLLTKDAIRDVIRSRAACLKVEKGDGIIINLHPLILGSVFLIKGVYTNYCSRKTTGIPRGCHPC